MEDFVVDPAKIGCSTHAEGACDSVCIEAAEASRDEVPHPLSGVGGSGVRPQDLASLFLWGSVYHIHGPQELEVFDGSAQSKYAPEETVGRGKGL